MCILGSTCCYWSRTTILTELHHTHSAHDHTPSLIDYAEVKQVLSVLVLSKRDVGVLLCEDKFMHYMQRPCSCGGSFDYHGG